MLQQGPVNPGQVGVYGPGTQRIILRSFLRSAPNNPILLHELLHAYHYQRLANGVENEQVLRFYRQAADEKIFPADSHIMSNPREYFAMMAAAYLFGKVDRFPSSRENIKAVQRDCYAWLEAEFGPPKQ
jgi:hypothetical protein